MLHDQSKVAFPLNLGDFQLFEGFNVLNYDNNNKNNANVQSEYNFM